MAQVTLEQAMQLAVQKHRADQLADAEAIYRAILQQVPRHPGALQYLGFVLSDLGRHAEAADVFRSLIDGNPTSGEAWDNLATALIVTGQYDEAVTACRRAIGLEPSMPEPHIHLGNALTESGRPDEALEHYDRAIAIAPSVADAHYNRGVALQELCRVRDAIADFERAISLAPDMPEAHTKLGMALLMSGHWARGWAEYEWRARWTDPGVGAERRWDGQEIAGDTILLRAEQGLGDLIQMIRYAPLVRDRGASVVVACRPELAGLIAGVDGVAEVAGPGTPPPARFLWTPAMSLPRLFGTTPANVPSRIPYLRPSSQRVEEFATRLAEARRPLVGLAWAGNPGHRDDQRRSIAPALLSALADAPVTFVSLQKDRLCNDVPLPMIDWTGELRDFADTAALVANLDLVLTVDTAVAHLAGAIGAPVWTMLAFVPDWRWMLDRADTPWYPTMRLFRQTSRGDWSGVLKRVATELRSLGGAR